MANIIIQNSGELPVWGLRLLGLSNKNADQIGQFGTGLKESIALLARLDSLPIIFSGTCGITFEIQRVSGQEEIHFQLTEDKDEFKALQWYGLGIHPDFGKADWNDPWMVFREIMCNAIDESGVEMLHHDIVHDEPSGVAGSTRFYLPANKQLMIPYSTVEDRLLMLGKREKMDLSEEFVDAEKPTHIFKKLDNAPSLQLYHRGVWVQEADIPNRPSWFDYDILNLKLTESRRADWFSVNARISAAFGSFSVEMCKTCLYNMLEGADDRVVTYEEEFCLQRARSHVGIETGRNWRKAFLELYNDKTVICPNSQFSFDRVKESGYTPLLVKDSNLFEMLKGCGVQTPEKVLSYGAQEFDEVLNPTVECQDVFDECWDFYKRHNMLNHKEKPQLKQFRQCIATATVCFGKYNNNICYINKGHAGTDHERMACLEELAHHITGEGDYSRGFQTFLVSALDKATKRSEEVES